MFRPTPPLPHSIPTYSALASPRHTLSPGGRVPARGLGAPASLDHDNKNNNNNNNNSITTKKKNLSLSTFFRATKIARFTQQSN